MSFIDIKKFILARYKKIRFGIFKSVNSIEASDYNVVLYPPIEFFMPEMLDVFGQRHLNFFSYSVLIPEMGVKVFKNAYCFTDKEEVFDSKFRYIEDLTTQEKNPLFYATKDIILNREVRRIDGKVAHLSLSGLEDNYGHFLIECLSRFYLVQESGLKPDFYILSSDKIFQNQLISLLKIDKSKIISTIPGELIQAEELLVPTFVNNWKFVDFRGYQHCQKQYLPFWINRMYNSFKICTTLTHKKSKIFISRKLANYRNLINENEVIEVLSEFGIQVYYLENRNVQENIELFARASLVMGVHGTGFVDMIFSKSDAVIFELFPEFYHDASLRVQAKALNLKYYYMIGEGESNLLINPQKENIRLDISKLRNALLKIFSDNNLSYEK